MSLNYKTGTHEFWEYSGNRNPIFPRVYVGFHLNLKYSKEFSSIPGILIPRNFRILGEFPGNPK
jgi:hypothetical protein